LPPEPAGGAPSAVVIRRASPADEAAAWEILDEYNRAVDVQIRDGSPEFRTYLAGPGAMWLAHAGADLAGCVVLRPLQSIGPSACEVKRLYVRGPYRGRRIAGALMDALEEHARGEGFDAVYLDSKEDLATAIRFYRERSYEEVERYNENPQATIFMRRLLGQPLGTRAEGPFGS
jgi:GNAT superfamily N-acetyltransferase